MKSRRTDEQGARCKKIRLMESDRRRKKEWIGDGSHAGFNGKSEERKQTLGQARRRRTGRDVTGSFPRSGVGGVWAWGGGAKVKMRRQAGWVGGDFGTGQGIVWGREWREWPWMVKHIGGIRIRIRIR